MLEGSSCGGPFGCGKCRPVNVFQLKLSEEPNIRIAFRLSVDDSYVLIQINSPQP